jgi:hypothetical protein
MSDTTTYFNKLWVIESLPQGDLKTGKALFEGPLASPSSTHTNLEVIYRTPETLKDFYSVLDEIYIDTSTTQSLPMIHIESHGSEVGIELASKEVVHWDDVRKQFIRINISTGLNLVVVMAACHGAHILRMAIEMDRAPFLAAIGTEKEVTAGHVELAFKAFYETFFETLSGDQALTALNQHDFERTYRFIDAEDFFLSAYRSYYKSSCRGKGKKVWTEDLLTKALRNPAVSKKYGVTGARKLIKFSLSNEAQDFEQFKSGYFMFDLFPDNKKRFTTNYEQAVGGLNGER